MSCFNLVHLDQADQIIFAVFYGFLAILTTSINCHVVHSMVAQKMHVKFTFRILFLQSVFQTVYGLISCTGWGVIIILVKQFNCLETRIFTFLPNLVSYLTHSTVLFLAFDRFIRVKFMMLFGCKITSVTYYCCYGLCVFAAVWQGVMTNFAVEIFGTRIPFVLAGTDFTFILLSITYILSIIELRKHQKQSKKLSKTDKDITKLAKVYLIIITICYIPHLATYFYQQIDESLSNRSKEVLNQIGLLAISLSGISNGIMFLQMTSKRRKIGERSSTFRNSRSI